MAFAVLISERASAAPFTSFILAEDDNNKVFPGWEGVVGATSDPYGTPDFNTFINNNSPFDTKFAVRIDGKRDDNTFQRYIKTITFAYWDPYQTDPSSPSSLFNNLFPGDLFIDMSTGASSDNTWDYLVKLPGNDKSSRTGALPTNAVYQLNSPLAYYDGTANSPTSTVYEKASGAGHRNYHPWGIKQDWLANNASAVATTADFSGYAMLANSATGYQKSTGGNVPRVYWSTFTFSDDGLLLPDGEMYIGFTVSCANDVVYDAAGLPADRPIPEPGTVLLLGTGLLGLATMMRRRSGVL
jgi:hypothetical protein